MNKEVLINKMNKVIREGYQNISYEKIVLRCHQSGPAIGVYIHSKTDGKYLNTRELSRAGYNISKDLKWIVADCISESTNEDFRMVLVIDKDSTVELEDEVFDSNNEGIDNAIWFYKYLGIVASENDRKYFENIEQTII